MKLHRPLILACAAALLVAFTGEEASARRAKTAKLRAMTFNIRFDFPNDGPNRWEKRADLVAQTIKGSEAHIICLQEDKAHQVDDLKARLRGYEFLGRGRNATGSGERCSIVFNTKRFRAKDHGDFWLSDTPEVAGSNTWGDKYPRKVTWALLQAKKSKKTVLVQQTASSKSRKKPHGIGVILAGDFNEDAGSTAQKILTDDDEAPFRDAWSEAPPNDGGMPGTYNGFKGMTTRSRIDWLMVGGPIKVYQARKIEESFDGRYPSDHYPVVADLEVF
jgi:endonuclease/exonuclease/phosphatase family metal-dependent hydrolase